MKIILLAFLAIISFATTAQELVVKPELLTEKKWTIAEDKQSGVGTHNALSEGSTIFLSKNGTWESSAEINGSKTGKWTAEKDIIQLSNNEGKTTKLKVTTLNEKQLKFEIKKTMYVRSLEWTAPGK